MSLESRIRPERLVALSLGGSLLLALDFFGLIFFELFVAAPATFTGKLLLLGLCLLLPCGLGLWGALAGLKALRRGVMDDLWDRATQNRLAARLRQPAVGRLLFGLALAGVGLFFLSLLIKHGPHHGSSPWGGFIYFAMAPLLNRTELLKILAPSRTGDSPLRETKPLVSSHWGER